MQGGGAERIGDGRDSKHEWISDIHSKRFKAPEVVVDKDLGFHFFFYDDCSFKQTENLTRLIRKHQVSIDSPHAEDQSTNILQRETSEHKAKKPSTEVNYPMARATSCAQRVITFVVITIHFAFNCMFLKTSLFQVRRSI